MITDVGLTSFELQRLGLEVGSSAMVGGIVGYATKKIAKLVLVFVGLELGLLRVLEIQGFVDVRWAEVQTVVDVLRTAVEDGTPPPDAMAILSPLSIGGGFAGGFVLGFKRG